MIWIVLRLRFGVGVTWNPYKLIEPFSNFMSMIFNKISNMSQGLKRLQQRAENGEAQAQWELALYYRNHPECCKTSYEDIDWARKAAEQDCSEAEVYVGEFCERHLDEPQAVRWYERAAKHGNVLGDYHLGLYYKEGRGGLSRDLDRAGACFLRAGEYAEAAYEYYDCLRERIGDDESDDWECAVALLKQSADGGYAPAQYALGVLYESAERFEEAQPYLKAAAKQKFSLAVEYLQAAADRKCAATCAEQARHYIDTGDYETALSHLRKGVKRDRDGICSYWYGDFWEHNYEGLLPGDDDRPDTQSRIGMAAGWYAYSYMCGYEPALERLIHCFLIDECLVEPTAEHIAAVESLIDKDGRLVLSYENNRMMYFGVKPGW